MPGDLIYYKNKDGVINHVAMYVGQVDTAKGVVDIVNQHSTPDQFHHDWMPEVGGNYLSGAAQAEFVHLTYLDEVI